MAIETRPLSSELVVEDRILFKILYEAGCPFDGVPVRWVDQKIIGPAIEAIQEARGTQVFPKPLEVTVEDLRDKLKELRAQITEEQFEAIRISIPGSISFLHLERMQDLNHALKALWQKISPSTLQHFTPCQIRKWMAHPQNQVFLQGIRSVYLQRRNLKVIPPEIRYLTQLRILDLSHNQIEVIPPEILRHLNGLEHLQLNSNQIKVIPQEIVYLSELVWLTLSSNQIEVIPTVIRDLVQLKLIFLAENQIEVIPPEIRYLIRMIKLDLKNNRIKDIHPEIKRYLDSIQFVSLEGNPVQDK